MVSSDDIVIFPDDLETGFWHRTKDKSALAQMTLLVWEQQVCGDIQVPFAPKETTKGAIISTAIASALYFYSPQSKAVFEVHFISNRASNNQDECFLILVLQNPCLWVFSLTHSF